MEDSQMPRKLLADLLASQQLAVLATQQDGQPYCSLMNFAASEDLRHLTIATLRSTRKYANMVANPWVSLLIDNRSNLPTDSGCPMALTVLGAAVEAMPEEKGQLLPLFLARHPQLEEFVSSADCALIRIKISAYYLVRQFQEVTEVKLP